MTNLKPENSKPVFPQKDSYIYLKGPCGKLELLISPTKVTGDEKEIVSIICHPHPLYDGTMHNKVVHTLHKALHALNTSTIRFNYRGVGKSEGEYGNSIGEYEDIIAIIDWIRSCKPNCKFILAGFSFGAFIAFKASKYLTNDCLQLVTVAPAITNQDYDNYLPITCPWLVIQGEQDEIVAPKTVYDWLATLEYKPRTIIFPNASHFFHGHLVELREKLIEDMKNQNY